MRYFQKCYNPPCKHLKISRISAMFTNCCCHCSHLSILPSGRHVKDSNVLHIQSTLIIRILFCCIWKCPKNVLPMKNCNRNCPKFFRWGYSSTYQKMAYRKVSTKVDFFFVKHLHNSGVVSDEKLSVFSVNLQ
jgi:hypothetical protein